MHINNVLKASLVPKEKPIFPKTAYHSAYQYWPPLTSNGLERSWDMKELCKMS
jgi:hypothetical protein